MTAAEMIASWHSTCASGDVLSPEDGYKILNRWMTAYWDTLLPRDQAFFLGVCERFIALSREQSYVVRQSA